MQTSQARQQNQTAFRMLKAKIDTTYPRGKFVAFVAGQIAASADSFRELNNALRETGMEPLDALVIQAGVEYPESAHIMVGCNQP